MTRGTLKVTRHEDRRVTVRRMGDGRLCVTLTQAEQIELGRQLLEWNEDESSSTESISGSIEPLRQRR